MTKAFKQTLDEARNAYEEGSAERIILDYLAEYGIGHQSAVIWSQLRDVLAKHGITGKTKNWFQNGLVSQSRKADLFIASCNRGFYIIDRFEDTEVMRKWYEIRVAQEMSHLRRLNRLTVESGLGKFDANGKVIPA